MANNSNELKKQLISLEARVNELADLAEKALARAAEFERAKYLTSSSPDKPDRTSAVLEELDKVGSMTMKDLADFLGASIQTAHVVAHEVIKERARCLMMVEPHMRNRRLRLVSMKLAPELPSLLKRLADN